MGIRHPKHGGVDLADPMRTVVPRGFAPGSDGPRWLVDFAATNAVSVDHTFSTTSPTRAHLVVGTMAPWQTGGAQLYRLPNQGIFQSSSPADTTVLLEPGTYRYTANASQSTQGVPDSTSPTIDTEFLAHFELSLVEDAALLVARVIQLAGNASVARNGQTVALTVNAPLYSGDVVTTQSDGAVLILFPDESSFALAGSSRLSIDDYGYDQTSHEGNAFLRFLQGVFVYTSGLIDKHDPSNVNMETPVGQLGSRGTEFVLGPNAATSSQTIYLSHGTVDFTPPRDRHHG